MEADLEPESREELARETEPVLRTEAESELRTEPACFRTTDNIRKENRVHILCTLFSFSGLF